MIMDEMSKYNVHTALYMHVECKRDPYSSMSVQKKRKLPYQGLNDRLDIVSPIQSTLLIR